MARTTTTAARWHRADDPTGRARELIEVAWLDGADALRCAAVRAYCPEELAIDSGAEPDEVTERVLLGELGRAARRAMWRADRPSESLSAAVTVNSGPIAAAQ